jgi:hypothetical protein
MTKANKAVLAALLDTRDGVTVVAEENVFQVGFEYSSNLISKLRQVPDAKFVKEGGYWEVPVASGAELAGAVEDMRDFKRNNGVQVKDMANGSKQVLFDFNKEMTQAIGPVDGAKFDNKSYSWIVPANSKALAPKGPGETAFFDFTINQMRGIVIQTAIDRDGITELAKESAKALGVTPGFVFPAADHSYSGPILNVNAHFAAQLTGRDDDKGVGYITVHNLSDLGKAVFKGEDMRIDYDEKRQVSVRTAEVFKEQQKERGDLTTEAANMVDGASVRNASRADSTKYNGIVVGVTKHFVLQHLGRDNFQIHNLENLNSKEISKGQKLEISYKNDKGAVVDLEQKKAQSVGQGR